MPVLQVGSVPLSASGLFLSMSPAFLQFYVHDVCIRYIDDGDICRPCTRAGDCLRTGEPKRPVVRHMLTFHFESYCINIVIKTNSSNGSYL